MLNNEYAYQVAKALVYPELTVEFAADVINGYVFGSSILDEVCALTDCWTLKGVFAAWDKMGRPDYWEYLASDYDCECDPRERRRLVANAREWAMAELVAEELYSVVDEIIVNEGWEVVGEPPSDPAIGWIEYGCDALDYVGEGWLIKP